MNIPLGRKHLLSVLSPTHARNLRNIGIVGTEGEIEGWRGYRELAVVLTIGIDGDPVGKGAEIREENRTGSERITKGSGVKMKLEHWLGVETVAFYGKQVSLSRLRCRGCHETNFPQRECKLLFSTSFRQTHFVPTYIRSFVPACSVEMR